MSRPKLWKYLGKHEQAQFFDASSDPELQSTQLGQGLGLAGFRGDARQGIKLDYCSYNLSFAQECKFNETQTSAFLTITLDLLEFIADGCSAITLKNALKQSLLPLLSVKSQACVVYTPDEKQSLTQAEESVVTAENDLKEFITPSPPPIPPPMKKGKEPPPPPEPEIPDPDRVAELQAVLEEKKKMQAEVVERIDEAHLAFSPPDIKKITAYLGRTLISHIKLYQFALSLEQEAQLTRVFKKVETTVPPSPLRDARTTEELMAHKQALADSEAAEMDKRLKKEADDQAAEQAAIQVAEAEAKQRAEEELRERQPTNLQEAVEKAVAVRLLDEKAKLQAEYQAREEQLMQKIRNIEAKLGPA